MRICFVNKMDRTGADYLRCVSMITDRLAAQPVPIQIPFGEGEDFGGIIDLFTMELVTYGDDMGTDIQRHPIPESYREMAETMRAEMIERIVENDDFLMEKYLMEEPFDDDELLAALRAATIANRLQPVMCGSALKNKGVQLLLDKVVELLPSPLDIPAVAGTHTHTLKTEERPADDAAPLSALIFKIVTDPYVGRLAFVRVYSGVLRSGSTLMNTTKGKRERIGRIVRMFADRREDVSEVHAGDIAAILGLKGSFTGDTLADPGAPLLLENISFPKPVIEIAIEPNSKPDEDKMGIALQRLAEEDPTFRVESDPALGQTILRGMGELHLEVLVDRLLREFGVMAKVGRPRVAYRETITRNSRVDKTFKRQTGGAGQYARVIIEFEPLSDEERAELPAGEDFLFVDATRGGAVPREFIRPVSNGVREALQAGVLAGYHVVGVKATLVDGAHHEVDSSEIAFKIAGSMCAKEGVQKAVPALLEPTMKVEIVAPDAYTGALVGDVSSRRGTVSGMETRDQQVTSIRANVPLGEMFGYATALRSMTQGRGNFTMEFDRYQPAPPAVVEGVLARGR